MYSVILVDDQPFCLKGMRSVFPWGNYGFEVVYQTSNPKIALEMLGELKPDVLCTDLKMPQISGIELYKYARMVQEDLKCILISGYEDFEAAKEAISLGVFDYCLKPYDRKTAEAILARLKVTLDRENGKEVSVSQGQEEQVDIGQIPNMKLQRMLRYIQEHYTEELSLAGLAEKVNLNPSFASRLFSRHTGKGFSQYLSSLRMERAAELLVDTTLSVEEISHMVGIQDSFYFSRLFSKMKGISPLRYRARGIEDKED